MYMPPIYLREGVPGVSIEVTNLGPSIADILYAKIAIDGIESAFSSLPSQLANPTSTN